MTRIQTIFKLIEDQEQWINDCEANGISYADGERGEAIREADINELHRLERQLSALKQSSTQQYLI